MKTRFVLALAMIAVLLVASSVSVAAKGGEVPFHTTILVKPTFAGPIADPPGFMLSVEGYGDVMHLGASTWHADQRMYFGSDQYMTINTDMVFTADDGDQLFGTYTGWGYTDENGVGHCGGSYQFTGGTGRFAGARGAGTIQGTHPPNVYGPLTFDGTLIK